MSTNGQLLDFKIQFAKWQQANVLIQHPRLFEQGCFYTFVSNQFAFFFFPLAHSQCFTVKNGPKRTPPRRALLDSLTSLHDHALCCETASQQQKQQKSVLRVNLVQLGGEMLRRLLVLMKIFPRCWTPHRKTVMFMKLRVNEGQRGGLWNKRYETILSITTSNLLPPVARQHISRLLVPVVGSVVFSLQTNLPGVQMESNRDRPTSS